MPRKDTYILDLEYYVNTKKDSKSFNERNDCAVVALSIAMGTEYSKVWEALNQAGRKPSWS